MKPHTQPALVAKQLSRTLTLLWSQYVDLLEIAHTLVKAVDETKLSDVERADLPVVRVALSQATADLKELKPAVDKTLLDLAVFQLKGRFNG